MDFSINILFKPFFIVINFFKAKPTIAFTFVCLINLITKLTVIDVADLSLNETIAIQEANTNIFGTSINEIGYSVFEFVYKLILFLWLKVVGFSVYGVRALGALLLSVAAGLLYKNIFKYVNFRVAAWVSLFYFLNNIFTFSAQDVSSNALIVLLTIVPSFSFIELYYTRNFKNAIKLGAINCLLFYVSNAFICVFFIQLVLFLIVFKTNLKLILVNIAVVLAGCNYWLISYFSENNTLLNQFNIGINVKNLKKILHLTFTDYFFFNLLFIFTLIVVLNIFVKKLNKKINQEAGLVYFYFLISFLILFLFIFKSKLILTYDFEIKSLLFFSLSLIILLGFIFGYQNFSSKINLFVFSIVFFSFLPAIKLGAKKNWPSKAIVNIINNRQHPKTAILCDNYLPFLFYLNISDFEDGSFKNDSYRYKNLYKIENKKNYNPSKELIDSYDTLYMLNQNKFLDSTIIAHLNKNNFIESNRYTYYGNYKLSVFYKN